MVNTANKWMHVVESNLPDTHQLNSYQGINRKLVNLNISILNIVGVLKHWSLRFSDIPLICIKEKNCNNVYTSENKFSRFVIYIDWKLQPNYKLWSQIFELQLLCCNKRCNNRLL